MFCFPVAATAIVTRTCQTVACIVSFRSGFGVQTIVIAFALTVEVLPFVTAHDVEVVILVEVLEVLRVGIERQVVFIDFLKAIPAVVHIITANSRTFPQRLFTR